MSIMIFSLIFISLILYMVKKLDDKFTFEASTMISLIILTVWFSVGSAFLLNYTAFNNFEKKETITIVQNIQKFDNINSYISLMSTEKSFQYIEVSDNLKEIKTMDNYDNLYIIEDNSKNPSIIKYEYSLNNKFLDVMFIDLFRSSKNKVEIIVPETNSK